MQLLNDRRVLVGAGIAVAALVAVALVGFAWSAATEPRTCVVNGPYGPIEYDCSLRDDDDGGASSSQSSGSEPWWTSDTAQAVYAFIGFGIPAAGGAWAFWRHRNRRQQLESFMRRLDETLAAHKADPATGSVALAALRQEIRLAFRQGRLDDAHFLELDKRATSFILKLRMFQLDHRFPALPVGLRHQVSTLISDGTVSDAEVTLVRNSLATQLIPGRVRDELLILLDHWARQDSGEPVYSPEDAADDAAPTPVVVQLKEP